MEIRDIAGEQPDPSWGCWRGFLDSCEVRGKASGVVYCGKTNCNYILFQDGLLVRNFGYHGEALMDRIREEGRAKVRKQIEAEHAEFKAVLKRCGVGK